MNSPLSHAGLLMCQPEYGDGLLSALENITLKALPVTPSSLALQICLLWVPTYSLPE